MSPSLNGDHSVNPVEDSSPNGSPAVNGSPGRPQEGSQKDALPETGTGTSTRNETPSAPGNEDTYFFKKMRGSLMIVAILAAGSTYQAGLNPPGGVWQNDGVWLESDGKQHNYVAGTPVMHDKFFNRYQTFFYCNAISFLASLVIIILLMNKNFYCDRRKIKVLEITMVLDLFSFMAAYAAGSCRLVTSSIYIFLLMGGVFAYVISFAYHYHIFEIFRTKPTTQNTEQHQRPSELELSKPEITVEA